MTIHIRYAEKAKNMCSNFLLPFLNFAGARICLRLNQDIVPILSCLRYLYISEVLYFMKQLPQLIPEGTIISQDELRHLSTHPPRCSGCLDGVNGLCAGFLFSLRSLSREICFARARSRDVSFVSDALHSFVFWQRLFVCCLPLRNTRSYFGSLTRRLFVVEMNSCLVWVNTVVEWKRRWPEWPS